MAASQQLGWNWPRSLVRTHGVDMPDVRTVQARSFSFVNNWNGTGYWVFALEDGTCLRVSATVSQAALGLVQISDFVAQQIEKAPYK